MATNWRKGNEPLNNSRRDTMFYRSHRNSPTDLVLAIWIVIIGGIIILAFTIKLQNRQQNSEQGSDLVDGTPAQTRNPSGITKLYDTDVQIIQPAPGSGLQPRKGDPAPDFTLISLTDKEIHLSDFRGQPVILNFWASWCGPCRYEMPALVKIYKKYKDKGLVILAVNMTYQDDMDAVIAFVDEFAIPFPVLLDEDGKVTDDLYKILGVPTSFFIRPDGTIATQYIGGMTADQLDTFVNKLLADDAGLTGTGK